MSEENPNIVAAVRHVGARSSSHLPSADRQHSHEGDLLDFSFKANRRNVSLIERYF